MNLIKISEQGVKIIDLDPDLFEGYLSEIDNGVWISHIKAKNIGRGDFSRLIKTLKEKYIYIRIPTPSSMMKEIAKHLGFIEIKEYFGEPFDEFATVMLWKKPYNEQKK